MRNQLPSSLACNKTTRLVNLVIHRLHLAEHYIRRDHEGSAQRIERFNLECEGRAFTSDPNHARASRSPFRLQTATHPRIGTILAFVLRFALGARVVNLNSHFATGLIVQE